MDTPKIWCRIRLTFCQMAGWLTNCSLLADWPSNKMSTWPSPGSDLGLGWHFVQWLVAGQLQLDGRLTGHLKRVNLTLPGIWLWVRLAICSMTGCWSIADGWVAGWLTDWPSNKMSTWPSPRVWLWVRLIFCQMAGWLANYSWLTGWLAIWQNVTCVKDGHSSKIWLRVRLTFCQMAGWLANCSWLDSWFTDLPSNKMSTWPRQITPWKWLHWTLPPGSDFGLGWHFVRWLVGWPIAAGWLADWPSNKMSTWPSMMSSLQVETSGQVRLISSGEMRYRIRLTFGQTYPPDET